jgi:hypothetical protein
MLTANSSPSLYLDYGADAQVCATGDLDISERGMRFTSRWQFTIGTQISVLLVQMDPRRGLCRMAIDGLVVWCEPKAGKGHESTLLFLELPDELKPSLREFSHQLAADAVE